MNINTIKKLTAMLGVICGLVINGNAQTVINSSTTVSGLLDLDNQELQVGNGGTGDLVLTGTLHVGGGVFLGFSTGDLGTITVNGNGFLNMTSGEMFVGAYSGGNGILVLTESGSINSFYTVITEDGIGGSVTVSGSAFWDSNGGDFVVGKHALGTLLLTESGSIKTGRLAIGEEPDGTGFVTISGSAFWNGDLYDVYVGNLGTGTLLLTDNAILNSGEVFLGYESDSIGTATVSGSAFWNTNTSDFHVGGLGAGTLVLADSGSVTVWEYSQNSASTLRVIFSHATPLITAKGDALLDGALALDFVNSGTLRATKVCSPRTFLHTGGDFRNNFATVTGTSSEDYVTFLSTGISGSDYQASYDLSWNQALHGNFTVSGSTTFIVDVVLSDTGAVNSLVKNGDGTLIFESVANYSGDTTINSGTVIYDQTANQTLNGTVSGAGVIVQLGSGTLAFANSNNYAGTVINQTNFSMNGVDQQIGTLVNNGNVYFVNLGKTLTVTNLSGSGTFHMDTDIAAGQSDLLNVTGTSAGSHQVRIKNTGASPLGTEDPLLMVSTADGQATFSGTVSVGMFDYSLKQDGNNWYLSADNPPAPQPGDVGKDILVNTPGAQAPGWFDHNNNIGNHLDDLRDSARERRSPGGGGGDKDAALTAGSILNSVWIKAYGSQLNISGRVAGVSVREMDYGTDLGADHQWQLDRNNTLIAGAFVGYGRTDRETRNNFGGEGNTDAFRLGLYGIWLNNSGWFADIIAKGQYNDNTISAYDASYSKTTADFDNWGGGLSADLGKRFDFEHGWFIEPSISTAYAHLTGSDYTTAGDNIFSVTTTDADVFQFKIGVTFGRTIKLTNSGVLQPYLKVAGVEQISTGGKVKASGSEWRPTLDDASAEIGGGIIWQLNNQHSLTLDYEASFGGKYDKPWGLTAGYRYQF